ncbi:MAG TPA: hypothetical protein VN721_06990 [Flavipsychrobacter sp.]|nr:hypothetical protein [Flavipsychrobacter sp.]
MKNLFLAIILLISVNAFAQSTSDYDVSTDKQTHELVYKGQCTFEDINKQPSFSWLMNGASEYTPDSIAVKYLKKDLSKYQLVVFIGTWNRETHSLLPKLYKVLQVTGYPMSGYKMYGVDRAKTTKYVEHKLYHISDIPTIIVIKNHQEIGRITPETLKRNIETDLDRIVEKDIMQREAQQ